MLVGAEEASKLYTPLGLGEILSRRTFTPGKAMNPLAQMRAANAASGVQALRLEQGELVASSEWRIALAMRLGTSFGEVTRDIMADVTAFQEAVLAPPSRPKQSGKGGRHNARNDTAETPERPPRKGDKGKPKGKSKGKGKGTTWKKRQWDDHVNDQRQSWSWQSQWQGHSRQWKQDGDDRPDNATQHKGQQQQQQQPNKQHSAEGSS